MQNNLIDFKMFLKKYNTTTHSPNTKINNNKIC